MSEIEAIYTEITETKTDKPWSKTFPAILKKLMTLEQAELLLAMPAKTEELATKTGISEEKALELLLDMFDKGLVFGVDEHLAEPEKYGWRFPKNSGLLRDMIGSSDLKYLDTELKELYFIHEEECFDRRQVTFENKEEWEKLSSKPSPMRVIPKWRAIKDIPGVLPIENPLEIFKASPKLTIINCPCKTLTKDSDPAVDIGPLESCIVGLGIGDYELKRGMGRELSFDEVVKISDDLDHSQLVTMVHNNDGMPYGTCNCHPNSCMVYVTEDSDKKRMGLDQSRIVKSRFVVVLDAEKCDGCGECVENRCPVSAVTLKDYPEYDNESRAFVNQDHCIGCALCVITCPTESLKMKLVRPPEHIPVAGEGVSASGNAGLSD